MEGFEPPGGHVAPASVVRCLIQLDYTLNKYYTYNLPLVPLNLDQNPESTGRGIKAGMTGLEPAIFAVTGRCINQLCYIPKKCMRRDSNPQWSAGLVGLKVQCVQPISLRMHKVCVVGLEPTT